MHQRSLHDHLQLRDYILFIFNVPSTTEIYTLSLHDALPISPPARRAVDGLSGRAPRRAAHRWYTLTPASRSAVSPHRSEEHTSELQSQSNLVCRLLLEKKKKKNRIHQLWTYDTSHIIEIQYI